MFSAFRETVEPGLLRTTSLANNIVSRNFHEILSFINGCIQTGRAGPNKDTLTMIQGIIQSVFSVSEPIQLDGGLVCNMLRLYLNCLSAYENVLLVPARSTST